MAYLAWSDLIAEVPEDFATQALDDNGDGVPEMWESVRAAAEREVDSYLEGRYTVPLTETPLPAIVITAAVLLCAKKCFTRRGAGERFPKETELAAVLSTLKTIRDGKTQLYPGKSGRKPRAVLVSGPARTHSTAGSLSS